MTAPASGPGPELNSASLTLLEFNLVREQLASYATFEPARELAYALLPTSDAEDVAARQQETSDARRFLEERGNLDLSAAYDLTPLVRRAVLGGSLRGAELRQVADTIGTGHMARQALSRQRHLTRLHPLSQLIPELPSFTRELDAASALRATFWTAPARRSAGCGWTHAKPTSVWTTCCSAPCAGCRDRESCRSR